MTTTSRRQWWITLGMSCLGMLMLGVFLGPQRSLPVTPRPSGEQNILRVAYSQLLLPDPHRRTFPLPAQSQFILGLWEPLVECDPETGLPRPAAAESWIWSDDRLTLTVKLRPDGRWSNGDPVTARDFVRGWQRLLRQNIEAAAVLFPLKNAEAYHRNKLDASETLGLEAVDDLTLRLKLGSVRSTLVAELADPLLAPLHETTGKVLADRSFFSDPERLVSNGAFQLAGASVDGFRLRASDYYHGRASVRLAGVKFVRVGRGMARLLLAEGQIDVMSPMDGNYADKLPTSRCITEESELALFVNSLDLNLSRGPLRDLRVRQALALAVDRAGSINKLGDDYVVPAYSWVPDMPGRPGLTLMREDEVEARRLLAEAGYPGGRGFPVLIMPVSPAWAEYAYFQAWVDRWHQVLGVRTYLAYGSEKELRERMKTGEYDIAYSGIVATVPDAGDLLGIFAQPNMLKSRHEPNTEIIRLLGDADQKSGAERLALLDRVERLAMADVATIPMMFQRRRTLLAIEVDGWYADPLGRQSLKHLAIRPIPEETRQGEQL